MRTLVTGHTGYIGTILCEQLLQAGHEVFGIDSGFFEDCIFGGTIPDVPSIRLDIRDIQLADLQGVDAVIHLAALSNDVLGNLDANLTSEINHRATIRLGTLAKQAGISRFLFSSSCSSYGASDRTALTEDAELRPVTPYGKSKVQSEIGLHALASESFSPTMLRNATAYGFSPRLRLDLVVNGLVGEALTTGELLLQSDGTPWRPLVHVDDIAHAFVAVLHAPRHNIHDQTFNIGRTEENYQIRDIAEIISSMIPRTRIRYAEGAGPDSRCYRVDCSRVNRQVPDFRPRWTLRKGIMELLSAYQEHGLDHSAIASHAFHRITRIQGLMNTGRLSRDLRWSEALYCS